MQYKRFPQDVSWLAARAMDVLYPLAARRAAAVVAISEFAKAEAVRFPASAGLAGISGRGRRWTAAALMPCCGWRRPP